MNSELALVCPFSETHINVLICRAYKRLIDLPKGSTFVPA